MIFVNEYDNIVEAECRNCGRIMKFRKNMLKYNSANHIYMLPDAVECFCENISDAITNVPEHEEKVHQTSTNPFEDYQSQSSASQSTRNVPRCPTCGSIYVKKITLTSKAVGGFMFGLFSSNVRNTYECLQCGYKW